MIAIWRMGRERAMEELGKRVRRLLQYSGDGKWLDSGYILKVKPTGFEDVNTEQSIMPDITWSYKTIH